MTRHQYRHGRTLDALELRGGTYITAESVREGDTVLRIERPDFEVADWEPTQIGRRLFGTFGEVFDCYAGERLCVIRGTLETVPLPLPPHPTFPER